ncbi:tetraspanin-32-like isoform X2 [Stegostoma tigrinum]|uniref:tetraspanin-32-like isoform X2 n=1 Tax=Stegostoma tigrinum TaxID=3053191 RepID=UPI00286FB7E9|nr:tetraspanin-32-like isoform X2 [Stegostoma tigrinum]
MHSLGRKSLTLTTIPTVSCNFRKLKKVNSPAAMSIGCLIRVTKYQLLGICIIVMLLGVTVAAVTLWISFNDEFFVIRNITTETNQYTRFHELAVYSGLSISIFLALLGIICLIGIVKESKYLLTVVLICFAVLFCGVVQMMYWKSAYKHLVESAVKDVYDFLYDDFMRNSSINSKQDLIAIHSAFLCCGKNSTFSHYSSVENETCFAEGTHLKDCLQAVENRITSLVIIIEALTLLVGTVTVHGMILTAFFCFAGCLAEDWHTKGKYQVTKQ